MFSAAQIFSMRLAFVALCSALVLALSADAGFLLTRSQHAAAVALATGQAAVANLDRSLPLDAQRRRMDDNLCTALKAAGEDTRSWHLSLMITGTAVPPALSAVVSTDQCVETRVLSVIAPESSHVRAEAVVEVPAAARPSDLIASSGD